MRQGSSSQGNANRDLRNGISSEHLIVKTPEEGIPAADLSDGTRLLGSAACIVLHIDDSGNLIEKDRDKIIWNIKEEEIPGDTIISAVKDKSGIWIAYVKGSADAQNISFLLVSADEDTNSGIGEIRSRTFTGPAYGSNLDDTEVDVYDLHGEFLNAPSPDLLDPAKFGNAELSYTDQAAADLWFGGDLEAAPARYWRITHLSCGEKICESEE